jgi:hypothetical protein
MMVLSDCRVSAEPQSRISVLPLFRLSGSVALQE